MTDTTTTTVSPRPADGPSAGGRALAAILEPIVASAYFALKAHEAFEALGHAPSPGRPVDGWAKDHWGTAVLPDFLAYLSSRASLLGQAPGDVVTATFGVFSPSLLGPAVASGFAIADPATVRATRDRAALGQLHRILGVVPDGLDRVNELLLRANSGLQVAGKPIYAGVVALGLPDEPMLLMWRLSERLREYRGDAFVAAFTVAGFDGCEIQILTERLAGDPPRAYVTTRGWSEDEIDAAEKRLQEKGLLEGDEATPAGAEAREQLERVVDRMCAPIEQALGDNLPELAARLQQWGDAIRSADGYYWSGPPEEIIHPAVQEWLDAHGLRRLGVVPV